MRTFASLRRLTPFLAGIALAALLAAAAFGLQTTLDRPTPADRLGVRVVVELESIHSVRSDQHLSRLPTVQTGCISGPNNDTVTLSDGRTLTVTAAEVKLTHGRWQRPLLIDAEARLAACPRILAAELSTRLMAGKRVLSGRLTFDGRPAYRIRIDNQPPTVTLIVSRPSLKPLAVRFRSAGLNGTSRLLNIRPVPTPLTSTGN